MTSGQPISKTRLSPGGNSFAVTGTMTINAGNGGSTVILLSNNNSVGGALTITSAQGNDIVSFAGSTASLHNVSINQGNGSGSVSIQATTNTITGNLLALLGQEAADEGGS